jgi:hypothetical protein
MLDRVFDDSCDAGVSPLEPSRALVPLTRSAERTAAPVPAFRPDARFVVHLIATAVHEPQTRALRRAAPSDAVSTYSNVVGFVAPPTAAANGLALARVA